MSKNKVKQPKKIKNKIIAAVIIVVLLVYLFFINTIIMKTLPQEQQILKQHLPPENGVSYTRGGVDDIIYTGGLTETLSISGWAFTTTFDGADNKRTELYLVNKNNSFHIPYSENSLRRDIYRKFVKNYDIAGMYNGYAATFATFTMPAGEYDLYLFNKENEKSYGLYKTGYRILKDSSGISTVETKIVDNFADAKENSNILFKLNKITTDSTSFKVSGWSFLEGTDPSEVSYFGQFTKSDGSILTTELYTYSVPDVATFHNTDENNYRHSGIRANIPATVLLPGDYTFQIIIQKDDDTYVSETKYNVNISDKYKVTIEEDNPS